MVNKLLKLTPWFLLSNVGRWIKANAEIVQNPLCLAMDRAGLNEQQFLGLVYAAIMAGGNSFDKLPEMIANNDSNIKHLSKLVGPLQECSIPETAASWLTNHCQDITKQTHSIVDYIVKNNIKHPEEYLHFSKVVIVGDEVDEFFDLYEVNRDWIQEHKVIF